MIRNKAVALWVFVAWTLFVWVQRVINIFGDDTLDAAERRGALVRPVVFVLLAVAVAWVARAAVPPLVRMRVVRVVAGVTIAMWVVQSVLIATRDHPVGFIVVHVVLGVVSVALAAWAVVASGAASEHSERGRQMARGA